MSQIILCSSTNSSIIACFFSFSYSSSITRAGTGEGHWNASWSVPLFLIQLEIISFTSIENWSNFEILRALSVFSSFCLSFGLNEHWKNLRTIGLPAAYSMISCAQTNNEIICDQAVLLPFLSPPSPHCPPPPAWSKVNTILKWRGDVVIAKVDKESRSSYNAPTYFLEREISFWD